MSISNKIDCIKRCTTHSRMAPGRKVEEIISVIIFNNNNSQKNLLVTFMFFIITHNNIYQRTSEAGCVD